MRKGGDVGFSERFELACANITKEYDTDQSSCISVFLTAWIAIFRYERLDCNISMPETEKPAKIRQTLSPNKSSRTQVSMTFKLIFTEGKIC